MAFPSYTKTWHSTAYPAISPSLPALSNAGKTVLITGGGSGLGPLLAHAFARSGATKISIIGRTASTLQITQASVQAEHPGVTVQIWEADITDRAAVLTAFEGTKKSFGPIDVLISNAAYLPELVKIKDACIDDVMKGFETNVRGNLILSQAFLANASASPTLLHLSSGGAHAPPVHPGIGGYLSSKLAAAKLMEYLAFENPHLKVISIHPGSLDTAMNKKCIDGGFSLQFDEFALATGFVVWAASPEADFLKGRFAWANWDVEELIAKKEEIINGMQLTLGLYGWL